MSQLVHFIRLAGKQYGVRAGNPSTDQASPFQYDEFVEGPGVTVPADAEHIKALRFDPPKYAVYGLVPHTSVADYREMNAGGDAE
jgi:hypothetical protein